MPEPERLERRRAALIAYDVCWRALTPSDLARRAAMRPVLDALPSSGESANFRFLAGESLRADIAITSIETQPRPVLNPFR